jgi:hypothetical protein
MKICNKCGVDKPNKDFGVNRAFPDLLHRICKICLIQQRKEARLLKPEVYKAQWRRNKYSGGKFSEDRRLLSSYGINSEMKNTYANIINNKCEICADELPLVVDHNHQTGEFRGLLCSKCNRGLGHFNDNKELLQSALAYITEKQ